MQTDAPVTKGISTKQTMKIWFPRGGNVTSPKMKFVGDEWHFTAREDGLTNYTQSSCTLYVAINRAHIVQNLPSGLTYEIRFMKEKNDYISLHGVINKLAGASICVVPNLTVVKFLSGHMIFDHKYRMMIELDLSVKEQVEKLSAKNLHLFSENSPFTHDCSILVEEKVVRVNRTYLSMHSAYFKAMFESGFKEKEQAEIELKDLDFNEFIELLSVVYPVGEHICLSNVECLLKLADRFVMVDVLKRCDQFLLMESNMENFKKLLLAQQYHLMDLQEYCASQYQQLEEIKKLEKEPGYDLLNEKSRSIMFNSLVRATIE